MSRKRSVQLDREIANALSSKRGNSGKIGHAVRRAFGPKDFPTLRVTRVRHDYVDEWYGVHVDFVWTSPFDIEAYRDATRAEQDAWFATRKVHAGLFPLEKAMADHITTAIAKSPQWTEFLRLAKGLPRFTARDIDNWDFDAHGGWASASMRDE